MHVPRRLVAALILAACIPLSGCATGDFRSFPLSGDMTSGDLAHYSARAGNSPVEKFGFGFPLIFAPVIGRYREATADVVGDRPHYHFEDSVSSLLFAASRFTTADFDGEGRNVRYLSEHQLLLGAGSYSTGYQRREDGSHAPLSSFSLLWGLFEVRRDAFGRTLKLFWIPVVHGGDGERSEPQEVGTDVAVLTAGDTGAGDTGDTGAGDTPDA